jgi:hypothetical protein
MSVSFAPPFFALVFMEGKGYFISFGRSHPDENLILRPHMSSNYENFLFGLDRPKGAL